MNAKYGTHKGVQGTPLWSKGQLMHFQMLYLYVYSLFCGGGVPKCHFNIYLMLNHLFQLLSGFDWVQRKNTNIKLKLVFRNCLGPSYELDVPIWSLKNKTKTKPNNNKKPQRKTKIPQTNPNHPTTSLICYPGSRTMGKWPQGWYSDFVTSCY